jgi:unsaturated rhamnogalacturonyl hydrolase
MNPLLRSFALLLAASLTGLAAAEPKIDFGPWPAGTSPQEIGRRVVDNFLPRPHMTISPDRAVHYAETCTWYGGLTFAQLTGDHERTAKLVARFDPLLGPEAKLIPRAVNVDNAVFGAVPLELFIETKDPRYLKIGRDLADQQWEPPAGDPATFNAAMRANLAAGLSRHTRFWIDDMYMITILQTQAFRATGDAKYLDRAALEAVAYLDKLQQPNGLFYHAANVPFFWGRGDGWFAAGMSELLTSLPANHPQRARILAGYQKMMAALLANQDADGMWHQLIDDPAAWPETSCTGMFAFGFITGVKHGWLDEKTYAPAARKAWLRLITYLNADGAIRDVCAGTGAQNNHQYYLDRPRLVGDFHGQAPVLWCASALLR